MHIPEKNLTEIFFNNVARKGDKPYLGWKEAGSWKTLTYSQTAQRVRELGRALLALGVPEGGRVAIFSANRPGWGISDWAILSINAVNVPIYATNSGGEAQYILKDSRCTVCIVEDDEHLERILGVWDDLPDLAVIIVMEQTSKADGCRIMTLEQAYALGRKDGDEHEFDRRRHSLTPGNLATIIYTSGTTGPPKGVMLSHNNFLANVHQAFNSHAEIFHPEVDESHLSFLPLSHVLERTAGWYLLTYAGAAIYYAQSMLTVLDDMKELKPSFSVSVPRLFEKIHTGILEKVEKASPLRKALFRWATSVGDRAMLARLEKGGAPLSLAVQEKLARRLVLDKVKVALGMEHMKVFVSGGAPLAPEINRFFNMLGVAVHEGYGLTETTPVLTVNSFKHLRFGTVGWPVDDTEIRIADDGEIVARGPQIMLGYHNQPEATREVLTEDGWFFTGDIGVFEQGFLKITDRKKNIIITAGGKNISPSNIEFALVADRFISQAMVIGDRRPYLVALLVPQFEALEEWAREQGITHTDRQDLVAHPAVKDLMESRVAEVNRQFARVEQIKRYHLLPAEFSQETGEMTPTLKLKRKVVLNKYDEVIESLYT